MPTEPKIMIAGSGLRDEPPLALLLDHEPCCFLFSLNVAILPALPTTPDSSLTTFRVGKVGG